MTTNDDLEDRCQISMTPSLKRTFELLYQFLKKEHPDVQVTIEELHEYALRHTMRHYAATHERLANDLRAYLVDSKAWWDKR